MNNISEIITYIEKFNDSPNATHIYFSLFWILIIYQLIRWESFVRTSIWNFYANKDYGWDEYWLDLYLNTCLFIWLASAITSTTMKDIYLKNISQIVIAITGLMFILINIYYWVRKWILISISGFIIRSYPTNRRFIYKEEDPNLFLLSISIYWIIILIPIILLLIKIIHS